MQQALADVPTGILANCSILRTVQQFLPHTAFASKNHGFEGARQASQRSTVTWLEAANTVAANNYEYTQADRDTPVTAYLADENIAVLESLGG